MLLLHHFGEQGQRAEVLPVKTKSYALFAIKNTPACDNQAVDVSGNSNRVIGDAHSNGGLKVGGSGNTFTGQTTYRTGCRLSVGGGNTVTATTTAIQPDPLGFVTPAHFPCTYSRAGTFDVGSNGPWWVGGTKNSGRLNPGVYCATGSNSLLKLGDTATGDVTFVANRVEISGSRLGLTPFRYSVLAYARGSGSDAIKVSGSNGSVAGYLYAPTGGAEVSGTGLTFGGIIAWTAKLSGNGNSAQG